MPYHLKIPEDKKNLYEVWYVMNRETEEILLIGVAANFDIMYEKLFYSKASKFYQPEFEWPRKVDMFLYNEVYPSIDSKGYCIDQRLPMKDALAMARQKAAETGAKLHCSARPLKEKKVLVKQPKPERIKVKKVAKSKTFIDSNGNPTWYGKAEMVECPHCKKSHLGRWYTKYHGDNCKRAPHNKVKPVKVYETCSRCGLTALKSTINKRHNNLCKHKGPLLTCTYCDFQSTYYSLNKTHNENCKHKPKDNG